jgi:secretion/DNA translocation related TadE-like protein
LISQRGSGTVLALAAVALALSVFSIGQVLAQNLLLQQRVQVVTETMALAAADALRGLNSGFPCPTATQIGQISSVELDRCRIVGFEVFISAHAQGVGIVLSASALAGPSY